MNIDIVYQELSTSKDYQIIANRFIYQDRSLHDIQIGQLDSTDYDAEVLYLFNEMPTTPVPNFICMTSDQKNAPALPDFENCNGMTLYIPTSFEHLYKFLYTLFEDDRRLNYTLQPVTDALLNDRGLQRMSELACTALDNPLWIIDMNYNYLTKPSGHISNQNLQEEIEKGYVLDETIVSLSQNKTREIVTRLNEAFSFQVRDNQNHMMMAAIKVKNITIAYINVYEENHPFTTYDFRMVNKLSLLFANELQKNSYFKNNRGLMFSYMLTDLLENKMVQVDDLKLRLQHLGYQINSYFFLLTVELAQLGSRDMHINVINEQIRYMFPNCIYCTYEHHSVFLISQTGEKLHDEDLKKLSDYLHASNLYAATSSIFTDLSQLSHYYQKTTDTLYLGQKYMPKKRLYGASELVIPQLFDLCSEHISYPDFAQSVLEKLRKYDEHKQTNYVETLYAYLVHNQQIAPTAKLLHIHENTLRYRIDKIEALINYALDDGEHIMELMLAYAFYHFKENTK